MKKPIILSVFIILLLLIGCHKRGGQITTTPLETTVTTPNQTTTKDSTTTNKPVITTTTQGITLPDTIIEIDANDNGPEFAGYGLVATGTDALLVDYYDETRRQILEYLFKDNYGPEIKLLKVEIGGGSNNTNTSVASHMPTRDIENYYAGYGWKILKEVQEINPDVKLMGLHWSLPSWVKTPSDEAYYIYKWVDGMKRVHGIDIDYIGGQRNEEEPMNRYFTIELRRLLDENGYGHVKIVGGEAVYSKWSVADLMMKFPDYNAAIDVIGGHYVSPHYPNPIYFQLNKPIWESEAGGWNGEYNTYGNFRKFLINYVNGGLSGLQTWGLSASVYENSWWHMIGIITAKNPWNGNWTYYNQNWAIAHINQFGDFGWYFMKNASGRTAIEKSYFATIKSPDNSDYSILIETFEAKTDEEILIKVNDNMPKDKKVYVWSTDINATNHNSIFVKVDEITPKNGEYRYVLKPNRMYSFTTTTGQSKKGLEVNIKPDTFWSPNYVEDFESYDIGHRPKYFIDIEGAFEVAQAGGGREGKALRQVAIGEPIRWYGAFTDPYPYTLFGEPFWTNIKASVDVLFETNGYVDLAIRASEDAMKEKLSRKGYYIRLHNSGKWEILKYTLNQKTKTNVKKVLASGTINSIPLNEWNTISIAAKGGSITAFLNGEVLTTVQDYSYMSGNIFLATSGYKYFQFDNLIIEPFN